MINRFLRRLAHILQKNCRQDKIEKKINELTERIALKPENAMSYSIRAICYRENNDYDKAIKDYTRAIELDPENTIFYLFRGNCYRGIKNYGKAIEDYTKAIELKPENANFYSLRGHCYRFLKKYDNAIEDYTKVIELEPKKRRIRRRRQPLHNYRFYLYRGRCYGSLKNYRNEIEGYDKAIELDPKYGEAYSARGKYYFKMENYCEALKNYDNAIELDFFCYGERADCHYMMKNYHKAIEDYNIAYDMDDGANTDYYYNRRQDCQLEIQVEHEQKIAQARIDERNKVIADLSHSIKNLISTIIDPLNNLKKEKEVKPAIIDDALKGANLIREIVNAMTLSFKGSIEDFYYDARNIDKDRTDLQSALVESLISSVGNMFDGKYFPDFQTEYFASEDIIEKAESEWTGISQSKNLQEITAFLRKYFFDCDFSFDNAADYAMGNEKGAAIKLLILFQELIQNAVKYSAFVSRENRRLRIVFNNDTPEQIIVRIENRYNDRINVSTSGIGHVIVENFCKLMETEPVVTKENGIYAVEIRFANFWKETDK